MDLDKVISTFMNLSHLGLGLYCIALCFHSVSGRFAVLCMSLFFNEYRFHNVHVHSIPSRHCTDQLKPEQSGV